MNYFLESRRLNFAFSETNSGPETTEKKTGTSEASLADQVNQCAASIDKSMSELLKNTEVAGLDSPKAGLGVALADKNNALATVCVGDGTVKTLLMAQYQKDSGDTHPKSPEKGGGALASLAETGKFG